MLTKEQANQRKIGGSSSAKVMGVSKYCTRFEQWRYDTGQIEKDDISDKIDVIVGNKLEAPLRKVLNSRGLGIEIDEKILEHPKYDFWTGYIDGYKGDTVVELKTSINWRKDKDFGKEGTDDIPLDYMYQVQHYLLHPRFKQAELHVVFLPIETKEIIAKLDLTEQQLIDICEIHEIRSYTIEPDFIMQENMVSEYSYYWKCVKNMEPPALLTAEEVTQRYLNSSDDTIPATDEILRQDSELRRIKSEIKKLTADAKELQNNICVHMGEHGTLIYGDKKIRSYKTQETRRLDTKRIKEAGLYDEYSTVSVSRVFR